MTDPLEPILSEAQVIAARKRLFAVTDQLTAVFEEVEVALRALELGARIEVPLEEGWKLGWGKLDREWHLILTGPEGLPCLLKRGPRRHRVQAAHALRALITSAAAQIEATATEVERAVIAARAAGAVIRELAQGVQ